MKIINLKSAVLLSLFAVPGISSAATIVVGDNGSVAAAVSAAMSGDTIIIDSDGVFTESLVIDKSLTLQALEGRSPTLKGSSDASTVIDLDRSIYQEIELTIDGLTIQRNAEFITPSGIRQFGIISRIDRGNDFPRYINIQDSIVDGEITVAHRVSDRAGLDVSDSTVTGRIIGFDINTTISNSTVARLSASSNVPTVVEIDGSTTEDISLNGVKTATIKDTTIDGLMNIPGRELSGSVLVEDSIISGGVRFRVGSIRNSEIEDEDDELTIRRSIFNDSVLIEDRSDFRTGVVTIEDSLIAGNIDSNRFFVGLNSTGGPTLQATNVTVTGFEVGLQTSPAPSRGSYPEYSFNNMMLANNITSDLGFILDFNSITHSLIADAGIIGVDENFNISGQPLLDDQFRLLEGSPGIDAGNNDVPGLSEFDLAGNPRLIDGDNDGIARVDMGAFESSFEPVQSEAGVIDASNPVSLNSWSTGFNATYEYEVQPLDTFGGLLKEWLVDVVVDGDLEITTAWINSGYNAGIWTKAGAESFEITNEGMNYIDELQAGDIISFTVQGNGSGFEDASFSMEFFALSQILPATGECVNPEPVTLPFSFDGQGEFCWEISEPVSSVNSWNTSSVTINGKDVTNAWSNSVVTTEDGKLIVLYNGEFPWSHFEANGMN